MFCSESACAASPRLCVYVWLTVTVMRAGVKVAPMKHDFNISNGGKVIFYDLTLNVTLRVNVVNWFSETWIC